ncbi:MAG: cobaltochelatase subunit CobN [Dialister sp.]|nr:cobaltochelatase subunit CobN [Dialister sp.]
MEEKIIYMTNVDRRFAMMKRACSLLQQEGKLGSRCRALQVSSDEVWGPVWEKRLSRCDMVMIRWMGNTIRTTFWDRCRLFFEQAGIPYYMDAAGSAEEEAGKGIARKHIKQLKAYSLYGGMGNYKNLWLYAASLFNPARRAESEPDPLTWAGIFHPDMETRCMTDLSAYRRQFCEEGRPTMGMLFYRDEWVWEDLTYQTALIREAEKEGMNVICVFTNGLPDPAMGMPTLLEVFSRYFTEGGKTIIDVLVSTMKFSFTASGSVTTAWLKQLGVPLLQGYSLIMGEDEWRRAPEGMNPMEISISISMPELDGIIHGVPIAAKHIPEDGDVEYLPIKERIPPMISKIKKWALLHRKANKDKRIAIIFHNYPPKNSNIGSAVGLDTIESIRTLLSLMKKKGYQVDFIPDDSKEFIKILTSNATNDLSMLTKEQALACKKVSSEEYQALFDRFGEAPSAQMKKDWGIPPGEVMIDDNQSILVPGTMNGNVFITVQAPRGYGSDPEKIYHDPYVAPTHQYLAYYQWIRDIWKADAVIHVGTHGNLEWLPGKGAGLDGDSYPDMALGDLPNLYFYHMTITGEGIQAKRRGAACLIDHLPAPLSDAGTYDELAELEKTMDEYAHFLVNEPGNAPTLEPMIRRLAVKANLDGEVSFDESEPFGDYVKRLHSYIEELKNSEVHAGLHVLGELPKGSLFEDQLLQLLRLPNDNQPSIYDLWAEKYHTTVDEMTQRAGDIYQPIGITYSELMMKIREETKQAVSMLIERDFTEAAIRLVMASDCVSGENEEWKERLQNLLTYLCGTVIEKLRLTKNEMTHAIEGLEGKYIEPGPSGSPNSNGAALLPTGINFYGIDPRLLPTKAAWELGKSLADQVVEQFIADEGRYPENIGIVFWSGANMRSRGQCIAEFLYLMGLRPVWQRGSLKVKGLEVISLSELKRPRIDVMGRISGLFRDTMPAVVRLLDQATLLAGSLDEGDEDNYVRKHIRQESKGLMEAEGLDEKEAWRQAAFRIFGDAPGTYGAGISAALENKNWQTIDDLASIYVRWGGHTYGGDDKGVFRPELFEKRLSQLDIAIKNEDNHETNMLSSDDYNAYHGGMIAAVRSYSGKMPKAYAGDSTDRRRPVVRTVQDVAKRVFRSEAINPKYIRGMMEHGYKGAADMSSMVSISFQWDATSKVMEDWMYEKYAEKYAFDESVQQWMKDVNPWALARIVETLLEAHQRKLWNAKEETINRLQELYLSVEGEMEANGDDSE